MGGLIKVTEKKKSLSGYEKVAILLGELGPKNSKEVLEILALKPAQMKKIRKTLKKLGKFSHFDTTQFSNEMLVLQQTTKYGIAKGILNNSSASTTSNQSYFDQFVQENKQEIQNYDSESVAKVLRNWLGD